MAPRRICGVMVSGREGARRAWGLPSPFRYVT
jgi:hypothetical protein